ncbi:MAG: glycosyltransferase family 2 protein [Candidatus Omnitrophica bacterium]|nr:glycosyltransferase family 2 protein [Candidatus Omnitrophota bacterium]
MTEGLSIIVPIYNEAEIFEEVFSELFAVADNFQFPYEVIIVVDGSTDESLTMARRLTKERPQVNVHAHEENFGIGAALRTGFAAARYEKLISYPADGQMDPKDLSRYYHALDSQTDFVTTVRKNASRHLWRRRIVSGGWRFFIRVLFGEVPPLEAGRIFRKTVLKEVSITKNTAMGNMELLIKAYRKGYRFKQMDVHVRQRIGGQSKVFSCGRILKIFLEMVQLRFSKEFQK